MLNKALIRGNRVTAIVRHLERVLIRDARLQVRKGDALKEKDIAGLTQGTDAVISAYNPG